MGEFDMKIYVAYEYEDLTEQDIDNLVVKMIGTDWEKVFAFANANDCEIETFEDCQEIEFC